MACRSGRMVEGAHILASVAAIDAMPEPVGKRWRDLASVLYCKVGEAATGIESGW